MLFRSPTVYGRILLRRGIDAFDALRQGLRDIEFLATSGAGDVWIGCPEPVLLGFVPVVIQRIARLHPKIVVHVVDVNPAENEFHRLREQKLDLMIGRCAHLRLDDDLNVHIWGTGGMSHQIQGQRAGLINREFDNRFLDRMVSDPASLAKIPHIEYVREAGAEAIELVMWLVALGAMDKSAKQVHRFHHVPASNTAVGHLILEN